MKRGSGKTNQSLTYTEENLQATEEVFDCWYTCYAI